jgi:hypothetical protein
LRTQKGRATLGLGVGALALLATTVVTGGVVLAERGRYQASCANVCDDHLYVHAHDLALATDVLLGIGSAAAATALILVLTRNHRAPPVAPAASAHAAGLIWRAAF